MVHSYPCFLFLKKEILYILFHRKRILIYLAFSLVPLTLIYTSYHNIIKTFGNNLSNLSFFYLISSFLLMLVYRFKGSRSLKELTLSDAFSIGLFQTLALLPGISRSGATIAAGRLKGFSLRSSILYSFLLAIPTILGGLVVEMQKNLSSSANELSPGISIYSYLLAIVASFITGYISLRWLLTKASVKSFLFFSFYCFILAVYCFIVM